MHSEPSTQSGEPRGRPVPQSFNDPPDDAPLNADMELASIPAAATISGMFIAPLVLEAKKHGYALPSARDRYVTFKFYPLVEHARLLVETCQARYPRRPLREALRKLGRGAPAALLSSTLGKVVLGSVDSVHDCIAGMVKAYPLNTKPCRVSVLELGATRAIVRFEELQYFIDSHHVGAFEGVLRYAGVRGTVRIKRYSRSEADFLLTWE